MSSRFEIINTEYTEAGVRFYGKPTAVLTGIASLVATAGLHANTADHMWQLDMQYQPDAEEVFVDTARETTPIGPGELREREITVEVPGEATTGQTVVSVRAESPYARRYEQDDINRSVDSAQAEALGDAVTELIEQGWTNIRVQVGGHASAEDDLTLSDAGLGSQFDRNRLLANRRRDEFMSYVQTNELLPAGVTVELLEGHEDQLEQRMIDSLAFMSRDYGYESLSAMIDSWNLGEDVAPEIDEALSQTLGTQRFVYTTITGQREVPGESTTEVVTEQVCLVPVRETITNFYTTETPPLNTDSYPIPKFIIVPIPAALPYRRKRGEFERQSRAEFAAYKERIERERKERYDQWKLEDKARREEWKKSRGTSGSSGCAEAPLGCLMGADARGCLPGAGANGCLPSPKGCLPTGGIKPGCISLPKLPMGCLIPGFGGKPGGEKTPKEPVANEPKGSTEQTPKEPREKRERKWPRIILPLILLSAGGVAFRSCEIDTTATPTPAPVTTPTTTPPCPEDAIVVEEVVDSVTRRVDRPEAQPSE